MTNGKIKAILFDMDGVLIDAREWHYEALNKALALFGMQISRYDHLSSFDGLPTKQKLKMLSVERSLPEELHDFLNEMKQKYTMQMVHEKCFPLFIHEFALSKLKSEGYKLAVCSNSIRKSVVTMMEKANLLEYFDIVLSNQDVAQGKPAPDIYLKAMEHFSLSPDECLIIEDNEKGILAAEASGGKLLVVRDVDDVNYANISTAIERINAGETNND